MNRFLKAALYVVLALFLWQWIGDLAETTYVPTTVFKTTATTIASISYKVGVALRTFWDVVYEWCQDFWDNLVWLVKWIWRRALYQAFLSAFKLYLGALDLAYSGLAFIPGFFWDRLPVAFDPSKFYIFSDVFYNYTVGKMSWNSSVKLVQLGILLLVVILCFHQGVLKAFKQMHKDGQEVYDLIRQSKERIKKQKVKASE